MAGRPEDRQKLGQLEARIAEARAATAPRPRVRDELGAGSIAWRMVTELVVGVLVGAAMGLGLDVLFGTMPVFVLVMGMFGFAAGVRTMMRSAEEIKARQAEAEGGLPGASDGRE
ncbi:MAG: AtpZ/AtpI family protein [Paracoccaceae bacterium]